MYYGRRWRIAEDRQETPRESRRKRKEVSPLDKTASDKRAKGSEPEAQSLRASITRTSNASEAWEEEGEGTVPRLGYPRAKAHGKALEGRT